MTIVGNRRDANPIIVKSDGSTDRPKRLSFTQRNLEEGWLQNLIENNPDLLPVSEIEPAFAPLISVGREVSTVSGSIDNLLLSPQGYLTIAETKLWRNPEARREVVGQLVDYAKDVSRWSFEELESKVRDYNTRRCQRDEGIMASLRKLEEIDETSESTITDTITRNLRNGRFLLLVVGDGIRESVEAMADYLQQTPQLHFTLALIELQIYELSGDAKRPLLVIPQVVARTREVTRAVVRVEGKSIESLQVGIDTETTDRDKGTKRFTLSEDDYFTALRESVKDDDDYECAEHLKKDMEEYGCVIQWRQASFVITLPDPGGSGQKLSLLVVYKNGQLQLSELANQLRSVGLPDEIARDYTKESAQLFGHQINKKYPNYWAKPVTLGELRQQYQHFITIIQKTIDRIKEAAKQQTSS